MKNTNEFFIPENYVDNISEDDYQQATLVIDAIKSLNRLMYHSIYIADYFRHNFLYVSDNPLFLCGLSAQEVQKQGFAFYFDHVPEEEVQMLLEINQAGFVFYNNAPVNERLKLSISYDFHIQYENSPILINHKLTPIRLAKNGNIWLSACVVSLATKKTVGNIEAYMDGESHYWTYSLEHKKWEKEQKKVLSEREKEVLILAAQGHTVDQIADKLFISKDTVKYHRKNLFEKINVSSISEALWLTTEKKMI